MYNIDTELLFPPRVISSLTALRSDHWREIVISASQDNADQVDRLAFILLMVRLCGCVSCNSDSFRAMRGCTQCSQQTIKRCRSSDKELVKQFQQAQIEVQQFLLNRNKPEYLPVN